MPFKEISDRRKYVNEYQTKRRARLLAEGKCGCGKPVAEGRANCSPCMKKHRERYRRLRDNSLCGHCKMPVTDNRSYCQSCIDKYRHNDAVRDRRIYMRARQTSLKQAALEKIGGIVCIGCGVIDIRVLTVDHKEGDGAKLRKEYRHKEHGASLYRKIIRLDNPETCYQVLCYNCQRFKGTIKQEEFMKIRHEISWGKVPYNNFKQASSLSELETEEDWLSEMEGK